MIRPVAAMMIALTLGVAAPAWAQEVLKGTQAEAPEGAPEETIETTREEELEGAKAETVDVTQAEELEGTQEDGLEAVQEEELEGAPEALKETTEEGLKETPEEEPEGAPEEEEEAQDEEEKAGAPELPATAFNGPSLFEDQLGKLIVDLQEDRASGRQYARAPERGKEALMQEVALAIPQQLLANECWTEDDAIIAGRRETIAIALRFDLDGRFVEEPRLVSPPEMPADDPALQRFIERTFSALRACNANGIKLPPKYFEDPIWVYFILQSRPE